VDHLDSGGAWLVRTKLDIHGDDHSRFMEVLVQMISEVGEIHEFCTVFWANFASLGNCAPKM